MCGNLDFVSRREKQKIETIAEMVSNTSAWLGAHLAMARLLHTCKK